MYSRPRTLDEAVRVLAESGGQILSGGTDFFPALGDRPAPDRVVDISGLAAIKGIAVEADHIPIGGLTTWSEVVVVCGESWFARSSLHRYRAASRPSRAQPVKSAEFRYRIAARLRAISAMRHLPPTECLLSWLSTQK